MRITSRVVFATLIFVVLAVGTSMALDFPRQPRLFPLVAGVVATVLGAIVVVLELLESRHAKHPAPQAMGTGPGEHAPDTGSSARDAEGGRAVDVAPAQAHVPIAWLLGFLAATWLVGFYLIAPLFLMAYLLKVARVSLRLAAAITIVVSLLMFGVFNEFLGLPLPRGVLRVWLPLP